MRNKFDEQLKRLHVELIQMGAACEDAISAAAEALLKGDESLVPAALEAERDLDRREREILDLRFGLTTGVPCTLEKVSEMIHLSRERVRQIQNQALMALRTLINEESREEFSRGGSSNRRIAELLENMVARATEHEKERQKPVAGVKSERTRK